MIVQTRRAWQAGGGLRDRDLLLRVDERHLDDHAVALTPLGRGAERWPERRVLRRHPRIPDVLLQARRVDRGRYLADQGAVGRTRPLDVVERLERRTVELHPNDLACDTADTDLSQGGERDARVV